MERSKEDVEYMLRRALSICLSDPKKTIGNPVEVDFSLHEISNPDALIVFCRPLLILLNAAKMTSTFEAAVIAPFTTKCNQTQNGVVSIDWEQTSSNYSSGIRKIAFANNKFSGSSLDEKLLCFILAELVAHYNTVERIFSRPDAPAHQAISHALTLWKRMNTRLRSFITGFDWQARLHMEAEKDLSEANLFFDAYAGVHGAGEAPEASYDAYQHASARVFESLRSGLRLGRSVLEWRNQYASLRVGLGPGTHLRFVQTRDAPHLFEIWSFLELSYILYRIGNTAVLQQSFLRSSRIGPSFSLGDRKDVYFNYYGDSVGVSALTNSKVIAGSHVEWFIRDKVMYENSVIIDTKYTDWDAGECRGVIGYLGEFAVNRGAVLFRGDIPERAVVAQESAERWRVCRLPSSDKVLFIGSLTPSSDCSVHNEATLMKMIQAMDL